MIEFNDSNYPSNQMVKTLPATGELTKGTLSKKWVFLYVLGCLVTAGICVSGSTAWLFDGYFHENLALCGMGIGIAAFLQATTLMSSSKRISHEHENISTGWFCRTLFPLLGSKVSAGAHPCISWV